MSVGSPKASRVVSITTSRAKMLAEWLIATDCESRWPLRGPQVRILYCPPRNPAPRGAGFFRLGYRVLRALANVDFELAAKTDFDEPFKTLNFEVGMTVFDPRNVGALCSYAVGHIFLAQTELLA